MIIVVCGPLFNLFFAIGVFFLGFLFVGQVILTSEIGEVKPGYPAYQAGLQSGDRFLQMAGRAHNSLERSAGDRPEESRETHSPDIRTGGNRQYATEVTPIRSTVKNIFGEEIQETVIGVTPAGKFFTKELDIFEAFQGGVLQTWGITKMTVVSLIISIQRKVPLETLGGPIFIPQLAGRQAQEGWTNLLFFTALLSANLGILNLLPIPILDGGHLVFFGFEDYGASH